MPKGSEERTAARETEIVDACARLYETMSFKDITIKEIGSATSFTRTSIYNYFQTREEIFLALLQREYAAWNESLRAVLARTPMPRAALADALAETLAPREVLLKLLAMNLYEIEDNARLEKLVAFKRVYAETRQLMERCLCAAIPTLAAEEREIFLSCFFPFVYGIYPYTSATEKQRAAMSAAGVSVPSRSIYEIARIGARRLLGVEFSVS